MVFTIASPVSEVQNSNFSTSKLAYRKYKSIPHHGQLGTAPRTAVPANFITANTCHAYHDIDACNHLYLTTDVRFMWKIAQYIFDIADDGTINHCRTLSRLTPPADLGKLWHFPTSEPEKRHTFEKPSLSDFDLHLPLISRVISVYIVSQTVKK